MGGRTSEAAPTLAAFILFPCARMTPSIPYETSDVYIAAFLLSQGTKFISVTRVGKRRNICRFESSEMLHEPLRVYWRQDRIGTQPPRSLRHCGGLRAFRGCIPSPCTRPRSKSSRRTTATRQRNLAPQSWKGVRKELLALWNDRSMAVDSVRRERQRKLDAMQTEIDRTLAAIDQCSNATVLKRLEEKVEALEAAKLRLGGQVEVPEHYDFERALNLVLDFVKKPLLAWKTGTQKERQMVLRLVFNGPLVYDRSSGFQTPEFSLPIAVSCVLELDELELVDLIRKSSNPFLTVIREWAVALEGLRAAP